MDHKNNNSGFGETYKKKKNAFYLSSKEIQLRKDEASKLLLKGRADKAELIYLKLLKKEVKEINIYENLLKIYKKQNRYLDAIKIFKKLITLDSKYAIFSIELSNYLLKTGNLKFAIQVLRDAINVNPFNENIVAYYGKLMIDIGSETKAIEAFQNILKKYPYSFICNSNLGFISFKLRKNSIAIEYYKKALESSPKNSNLLNNIGSCYYETKDFELAIDSFNKSLSQDKENLRALNNLGVIYCLINRYDLSKKYLERSLFIDSTQTNVYSNLLKTLADICDWSSIKKYLNIIKKKEKIYLNLRPFTLLALEDEPLNHLERAKNTSKSYPLKESSNIKINNNLKIRVGYFSSDFHDHATMHLMNKVFQLHDKNQFEIFIYSYGSQNDDVTKNLIEKVYSFKNINTFSDQEIVSEAKKDNLNIAVDLKGHTKDSRFSIFSYRLAPIQISYLGFPGTSGSDFIDYLIADKFVIPEERKHYYSEKIIYLDNCYQCNDNSKNISAKEFTRKDFNLPDKGIIFTCFNASYKITKVEFEIWMNLLHKVKNSNLWLYSSNKYMEDNLKKEAEKRGINPKRIVFANRLPIEEHLARHKLGDIFLDTFNCNAHTTASDALWAGLPIITVPGRSFSSRVAGSLLKALDLNELICSNKSEYYEKALYLANNPSKLLATKKKILANKSMYPLFDSKNFTKNLESVFKKVFLKEVNKTV